MSRYLGTINLSDSVKGAIIKEFRVFNYIVLLQMLGPFPAAYSCLSCQERTPVISRAPILRKYTIKEDVSGGETSLYVGFHKTVQSTIVDFDVRLSQVNLSKNLASSYTRFTLLSCNKTEIPGPREFR